MKVAPLKADNEFWSLTMGQEYVVIGLDDEYYRIVDNKGEPILFPKRDSKYLMTVSLKIGCGSVTARTNTMRTLQELIGQDSMRTILTAKRKPWNNFGIIFGEQD